MATGKKLYWLKLDKNFFKRHDVRIIESQENGKDYILFYLKLLLESITHEGELRFSETIPYDEKMLSVITNTNIDIVRSAIKIFTQLGLMKIYDDKTIYMEETTKMLGIETDYAKQKRIQRANQKLLTADNVHNKSLDSPKTVHTDIDIDIELDKDKDIEIEEKKNIKKKKPQFIKPTIEDISAYCKEKNYNVDAETFYHYYESKGWLVGKVKMKSWQSALVTWNKKNKDKPTEEDDFQRRLERLNQIRPEG